MLKALIKKQLSELFAMYFIDRKTGKARSKKQTTMYIGTFVVILLYLSYTFFTLFRQMAMVLCTAEMQMGWLYYGIAGIISLGIGTFATVFNTYGALYKAKDNDALLSMPIPPAYIIISRMVGAYIISVIYGSVVFIPAMVAKIKVGEIPVPVTGYIYPVLQTFMLAFIVMAIACLIGKLIAEISLKFKRNNIIVAILSIAFIGLYYFVWMKLDSVINNVGEIAEKVSSLFESKLYIIYALGKGAEGNTLHFAVFALFSIIILALTCFFMAKGFYKSISRANKVQNHTGKIKETKVRSVKKALLMKEYARFTGSANYMMNSGMGALLLIVAAVPYIIKGDQLALLFESEPLMQGTLPIVVALSLCALMGTCTLAAPSISLEGKMLWILQSMPLDPYEVLRAKAHLQFTYSIVPAVISAVTIFTVLGFGVAATVAMCLMIIAFAYMASLIGVWASLKNPMLEWTNEIIPIKQGVSVIVSMLSIVFIALGIGAIYYGFTYIFGLLTPALYMVIMAVVICIINIFITKWLKTKGSTIFAEL